MKTEIEHCRHFDPIKNRRRLTCPLLKVIFVGDFLVNTKPKKGCTDKFGRYKNFTECNYYED